MSKIGSNPKISQDTYVKKTQILILKIKEALNCLLSVLPISNREYFILKTIDESMSEGNKITSSDISRQFGVSRAAVSQYISSLESEGYILRYNSENDRRRTYLITTEKALDGYTHIVIDSYLNKNCITVKDTMGEEKFRTMLELIEESIVIIKNISEKDKDIFS